MNFTELFIRRPVLAMVVSLLIVLLGLRAFNSLSLREYPEITYPVINVVTSYPGANADLMQGFITRPLQRAVVAAEGIDFVEARSVDGLSSIAAHLRPGYSVDAAFADISAKVQEERRQLPRDAEDPIIAKETGFDSDILFYLSFTSKLLSQQQITDYLDRVVRPVLSTVQGMGSVEIHGKRDFAMRVWLDPQRLAALNLSAADVRECFHMVTTRSAKLLNLKNYGVKISDWADLAVLDAEGPEQAVAEVAPVLYSFKRGRHTLTRNRPHLHRPH